MKNIIENIAQEQDVAWGIIAQKIDENFAEIEEKIGDVNSVLDDINGGGSIMGTTAEKLNYLAQTKEAIKSAIIAKGVDITEDDTFRSYASKIQEIQGGTVEGYTPNEIAQNLVSGNLFFTTDVIGAYSFYGDLGITGVDAPNAVTIGTYAFYNIKKYNIAKYP